MTTDHTGTDTADEIQQLRAQLRQAVMDAQRGDAGRHETRELLDAALGRATTLNVELRGRDGLIGEQQRRLEELTATCDRLRGEAAAESERADRAEAALQAALEKLEEKPPAQARPAARSRGGSARGAARNGADR